MKDFTKTEMELKNEQIKELKEALNGTIVATGYLSTNYYERRWEINTSSILTKLIQEAGRWCEDYASDLYLMWRYRIDERLEQMEINEDESYIFAFRAYGVDNADSYERNKSNPYFYRAVWHLDINVTNGIMKMILHK